MSEKEPKSWGQRRIAKTHKPYTPTDKPAATGSGEPTKIKHVVNGDERGGWYCYACRFSSRNVSEAAAHDGTFTTPEQSEYATFTPPASQSMVTPNDTDRLTWLTQTTAYVAWSRDGETCHLVWPYDPNDEEAECGPMQPNCYTSPREAIDVAMRENMPNSLALLRAAEQR